MNNIEELDAKIKQLEEEKAKLYKLRRETKEKYIRSMEWAKGVSFSMHDQPPFEIGFRKPSSLQIDKDFKSLVLENNGSEGDNIYILFDTYTLDRITCENKEVLTSFLKSHNIKVEVDEDIIELFNFVKLLSDRKLIK